MIQPTKNRKTRGRLLMAACEVFGEKGYRDTRVADICRRAGTNVASVNYYFGGKAALYQEAWQTAFEKGFIPEAPEVTRAPSEKRLRHRIDALVRKFFDRGSVGLFTRMYLMELANPTGLINENWRKLIEPRRKLLLDILYDLLGPETPDEDVFFCELSIINQCRGFAILGQRDLEYLVQHSLTPEWIEKLADHITNFSLAGIQAIKDRKPKQPKLLTIRS